MKTVLQKGITKPVIYIIVGSEIYILRALLFPLCNPPFYLTTTTIALEEFDKIFKTLPASCTF